MPRLILASTSTYRQALLARIGLDFEAAEPDCDEDAVKAEGHAADVLVTRLARLKAESVAGAYDDALIIGSDQVAEVDCEILGKPGTAERAAAQLRRLAGREHRLLTAVCVLETATGRCREDLDVHVLRLRDLTDEQIARYVAADQPLDCAGAYKIEGLGITLFERLRGRDYTAIIGLPLTRVVAALAQFGIVCP
jgi:septum formation protein